AAPAAPALDQQQLNSLSLNLAAVRQSVEQLATQVASAQQQMSGEIAKLQASEQDILNKIAAPAPRPAPVAARKPPPPPPPTPPPPAPHRLPPGGSRRAGALTRLGRKPNTNEAGAPGRQCRGSASEHARS